MEILQKSSNNFLALDGLIMVIFEKRAASILFNVIRGYSGKGVFILPANVCPIVPLVFLKANVSFELCDISPITLCLDQADIYSKIQPFPEKYAGVLFVRTYGVDYDYEEFFENLKKIKSDLFIIDDRCLLPINLDCRNKNTCDLILYSSGYAKVIDVGFGGIGFLNDSICYERKEEIFDQSDLSSIEMNYKKSILNKEKFFYKNSNWLDLSAPSMTYDEYKKRIKDNFYRAIEHKMSINEMYSNHLPLDIQLSYEYQIWRFNILVPEKEILLKSIEKNGLFASSHYASLGGIFSDDYFPVAESLYSKVVNLFNDYNFDKQKAGRIIDIINRHINQYC